MRLFLSPPLELLMDFLVIAGFIYGCMWLFALVVVIISRVARMAALSILRLLVNCIKGIFRFIFPWAFRSGQIQKEPVGFHPYPRRRKSGFLLKFEK